MNNYNEEMYSDRYSKLSENAERCTSVNIEMNTGWMRNNPLLAVESIIKFFEEYNDKHFDHSCEVRFVPGHYHGPMTLGYLKLYAKKKK